MPKYSYTVEDVLVITGRGLVAVPGIPRDVEGARRGASLQLRRPGGTVFPYHIQSSLIPYPNVPTKAIHFSLPPGITKIDVPIGTEVWLADVSDTG